MALSGMLDNIVEKRAAQAEFDRGKKDFLSVFLNAKESTEAPRMLFTTDYVSTLTYEHLLAGASTMAFTLSSLAYLVAGHPEVEEKLLREIDGFGPKDSVPSAEELHSHFPYLEQVLKETMRFFTVSPLIASKVSEDVEIGGYVLPKGTWVWLAQGVLAKDPKEFPDLYLFRLERFDPESDECTPTRSSPSALDLGRELDINSPSSSSSLLSSMSTATMSSPRMETPLEFQFSIVVNFKHGVKLQVIERNK